MKHTLEEQENLWVKQDEITQIRTEDGAVSAVRTAHGAVYQVRAVVIATGTYLGGRTIVGDVGAAHGGVAGHVAHRVQVDGEAQCPQAHPGGG